MNSIIQINIQDFLAWVAIFVAVLGGIATFFWNAIMKRIEARHNDIKKLEDRIYDINTRLSKIEGNGNQN